jgi:hypothetical protein
VRNSVRGSVVSRQRLRELGASGGALLVLTVGSVATVESAWARRSGSPPAWAAHALRASDTARLHYVSASGSLLYEEGHASGTLPGKMKVHLRLGSVLRGSFTLYLRGGWIKGHGEGVPHGSGVYESFAGSLVVTGGTGRYRHARGRARLYGTFNRNTYALVVQTRGTLRY